MEQHDTDLLRGSVGEALLGHAGRLSGGADDLVRETTPRTGRHPDGLAPVRAWPRSAQVGEVVTDMIPEPPPGADEADRAVEAWTVAEALGRLSAQHREVLVECFYRGRSVAEAAARLGVPPGTVKSRTHYALRSLRVALDEMGVTG